MYATNFNEINSDDSITINDISSCSIMSITDDSSQISLESSEEIEEFYISKCRTVKWMKSPVQHNSKFRAENIIRESAGLTSYGRHVSNIEDSFYLFDKKIMKKIMKYTNKYASSRNPTWNPIVFEEFKKFIRLMILLGVYKSKVEPLTAIWDEIEGRPIVRKVMSLKRYRAILRYLCFDDVSRRNKKEKGTPYNEVFDMFRKRMPLGLIPGESVTVDEQLVNLFGRCSFKNYIPSKPGKYGIKI